MVPLNTRLSQLDERLKNEIAFFVKALTLIRRSSDKSCRFVFVAPLYTGLKSHQL